VANAIGIDFDQLPLTPDRVMQALVERRRRVRASALKGQAS
jgi:4-hydroxybenzoyl-CoA reductase subunit alpha